MTTPAMPVTSNSSLQDAIAPARQPGNAAPDGAFNQALSREIAGRKEASRAEEAKSNDARQANQAQHETPAASAKTAAADKPAKNEKDNSSTDKTDGENKTEAADAKDDTAATTPAGMLALMIDAGRAAGKAAEGEAPADAKVRGKALLSASTGSEATSEIDAKTARADAKGKAAADATDFRADLRKAGNEIQQPDGKETSKLPDVKAEALLKHANIQDMQAANAPSATATAAAALQQAATVQNAQAAAGANNRLAPQVGAPGWDGALAQKVVWMVAGEHQSATLTLNPPDLGPLQVVLNVSNSMASATFTAAQPEVRQALENAMPKLREMLNDAGIQLGQANVNTGTPNGNDTPRDSSSSHQSRGFDTGTAKETPIHVGRVQPAATGRGLVDTFV